MLTRDHYLATSKHVVCLLLFMLLVPLSPTTSAFHGGDDDPETYHLALSSDEGDEIQLFENVVHLTEAESNELFSLVSVQDESAARSPQLTLYLERRPSSLAELGSGNILAAAVTPPETLIHQPWEDATRYVSVNDRLVRDGLLHRVISLEEDSEGWRLQLEQATLADAIKQGTLVIEASRMIRSLEDDMFGQEPYIYQEGDHYRKVSLHTPNMHCTPGRFHVDTSVYIDLPNGNEAEIGYSAVLHMKYALSFKNGQLENAELASEVCQMGSITLGVNQEIDNEWLLWKDRSRPKLFRIGLLPVIARAGGSLTYGLATSAEFKPREPILFRHDVQRQVSRSHGNWNIITGPELAFPAVAAPDLSPSIEVQATSKLVPQLEVILYGVAGPYIQAAGSVTMVSSLAPPNYSLHAGLVLQAGIQQDNEVVSLCPLGECETTLNDCEWGWDFDQNEFSGPVCK